VEPPIPLTRIRERCREQISSFEPLDRSTFPVVLHDALEQLKSRLIDEARDDD
jgi:hypothetical protein